MICDRIRLGIHRIGRISVFLAHFDYLVVDHLEDIESRGGSSRVNSIVLYNKL